MGKMKRKARLFVWGAERRVSEFPRDGVKAILLEAGFSDTLARDIQKMRG
jgi:hypothetical protein